MKALSEKYPELKDQDNLPDELKASQEESEKVAKRMVGTFMKTARYMNDAEVRKAQERISKAMSMK
jgi:hypothetical protein